MAKMLVDKERVDIDGYEGCGACVGKTGTSAGPSEILRGAKTDPTAFDSSNWGGARLDLWCGRAEKAEADWLQHLTRPAVMCCRLMAVDGNFTASMQN